MIIIVVEIPVAVISINVVYMLGKKQEQFVFIVSSVYHITYLILLYLL